MAISIDLLGYISDLYVSLFSALLAGLDYSHLYDSLFSSLVPSSTPLFLTNESRNFGVSRGPLIDFLHRTSLLHYWLLLSPNALHQPISFVSVNIMFQSLIWVEVGPNILTPLQYH